MTAALHLPLAKATLNRDAVNRDHPELFDQLWGNPLTRVLAMHNGEVLLQADGASLNLLKVDQVPSAQLRVYLGFTEEAQSHEPAGTPVVLAVLSGNAAAQLEPESANWHGLRKSGAGLSPRDAGIFAQALALANWHETHVYCTHCGTPTMVQQGGWSRRCFKDEKQAFPRTDPAIIVAVTDAQDRLLMGSQGKWEDNRWSVLAGFVEPGESLVAAVVREVFEESGIKVVDPQYLGSQSWPFPYSLMVAFTAHADPSLGIQQPVPDGGEIVKVRWFSRAELAAEAAGLILPSKLTIARSLIDNWFGEDIPNLD